MNDEEIAEVPIGTIPAFLNLPEGWSLVPIKGIAKPESGHTPDRSKSEYWDGEIPWYSLADVTQVRKQGNVLIEKTSECITPLGVANSSARVLPRGTVVISRTASIGFPCILGVDAAVDQSMAAWVPSPNTDSRFLYYCLKAMQPEFDRLAYGSTHLTIYVPDLLKFKVPHPPLAIQKEIAAFLDEETERIDELIAEKQEAIRLLRERREAVISAAVTGNLQMSEVQE